MLFSNVQNSNLIFLYVILYRKLLKILTIFPMLYTLIPICSENTSFFLCVHEFVSVLFVHLFYFLDSTYK